VRESRANCIAAPHVFGRKPAYAAPGHFIGFQWFDAASYGPADPGTFGTCGVGTARGPGLRTANISVLKEFPWSESKRLEFRVEFFNITNTPILNSRNRWLDFNLGLILTSQGERNIQFALKVLLLIDRICMAILHELLQVSRSRAIRKLARGSF
jgi:hypothetical protein